MLLRPTHFTVTSSTGIKIVFTDNVSDKISASNFTITSLGGNIDDLEILSVSVKDKSIEIKTRPQVSGNFYLLKMIDTDDSPFSSERGASLINDDNSREIFFIGIDSYNPIRDRIFEEVPHLYSLENTLIKDIVSSQADEIYKAQKHIGEVLSDNYISETVINELRTRGAGATDRLGNEGSYSVDRVSKIPEGFPSRFGAIDLSSGGEAREGAMPSSGPVSLRRRVVSVDISEDTSDGEFDGYLISLANKNIIKLLSLALIKENDIYDCNNEIGTDYNIERYKYSILDNKYDREHSLSYFELKSNQILISEFGNIDKPRPGDKLIISYAFNDFGIEVSEDSVSVFNVKHVAKESIPTNISRFFLSNAPIVFSNNEVAEIGGVAFSHSSGEPGLPSAFLKELKFNTSRLPMLEGEYSINYETGEVIIVGDGVSGTGSKSLAAQYYYRDVFENNLDYYVDGGDVVASKVRDLGGQEVKIEFSYGEVFSEGDDYRAPCHEEVSAEHVENNFTSSFSVETAHQPITNVFRIVNQTTGEVYKKLYTTDTEIHFTGRTPPKFESKKSEMAEFLKVDAEKIEPFEEFVSPAFKTTVVSGGSNSNIKIKPGIPAELIDENSKEYFIRGESDSDDLPIQFFGSPDSEGVINSVGISNSLSTPMLGSEVIIGPRVISMALSNIGILNKELDAMGVFFNSSLSFSKDDVFIEERFFSPLSSDYDINEASRSGFVSSVLSKRGDKFFENLSRITRVGDYVVDYAHGVVYLGINKSQDPLALGTAKYSCSKIITKNPNLLSSDQIAKKNRASDSIKNAAVIYEDFSLDSNSISLIDLEPSFESPEIGSTFNSHGEAVSAATVLGDYTVAMMSDIRQINGIYLKESVVGASLDSRYRSKRKSALDASLLTSFVSDGGGNIYNASHMKIDANVIDLKRHDSRYLIEKDGTYSITVKDSNISKLLSITLSKTGEELFDEKLNVTKIDDVEIVFSNSFDGTASAGIRSGSINSSIDNLEDFLLDSDGNRFEINNFDSLTSTLDVFSPAVNNVEAQEPTVGAGAKIIVKATVDIYEDRMEILIPSDAAVANGDMVDISYIDSNIPEPGDSLIVDYRYGKIFLDYSYVADDIYVSYEYGDNQIDWSISNAMIEGQDYYVSYKYGALRDALRKNFGNLTDIPFFKDFSMSTDRETYRSALLGTLEAFTSGPTVPAFKSLIESFTLIEPEITESHFGNWILGRDYLSPGGVEYSGVLDFSEGRFGSGLMINDDNIVKIPSDSNISIEEGTLSAWIRPEWAGINNDATLTINLDDIGEDRFYYNTTTDPFSLKNKFELFEISNAVGTIDYSGDGVSISNYKMVYDESGLEKVSSGEFGLKKSPPALSHFGPLRLDTSIRVDTFSLPEALGHSTDISHHMSDLDSNCVAAISISDNNKSLQILLNVKPVRDSDGNILIFETKEEHIDAVEYPSYEGPYPIRGCVCAVSNVIDNLLDFRNKDTQVIRIELDHEIDLSSFLNKNFLIDESPSVLQIVDSNGGIYEVYAFLDLAGRTVRGGIPTKIGGFIIERIPGNMQHLSAAGSKALNDYLPIGRLRVVAQSVSIPLATSALSEEIFNFENMDYLLDWSSGHVNVTTDHNPLDNVVSVLLKTHLNAGKKAQVLYSDLMSHSDSSFGHGISISAPDSMCQSVFNIGKYNYSIKNRFGLEDIFIGKTARNPMRMPFSVNKDDFPLVSSGLPHNADVSEGIFIGFDETCESPLSEDAGQWVIRSRIDKNVVIPSGAFPIYDDFSLEFSNPPAELSSFFAAGLVKYINVFGIHIFSTSLASSEKVLHVANVLAQLLDNDEDGHPDNKLVIQNLTERNSYIIVSEDRGDFDSLESRIWEDKEFNTGIVIYSNDISDEAVDPTTRMVWSLIGDVGYSNTYPDKFGLFVGSELTTAMNTARGGYYPIVPAVYPISSWYHDDNKNCDFECQISKYLYWGISSLLGEYSENEDLISEEWEITSKDQLMATDPALYSLVINSDFGFPSILPDGSYKVDRAVRSFQNTFEEIHSNYGISGKVTTNGEFSSVLRARRSEDENGCRIGAVCSSELRYCGDGLIEESGWRNIRETQSELINVITGGSSLESIPWAKVGDFSTNESGGIYRMSGGGLSGGDELIYSSLPCSGGEYSASVFFRANYIDQAGGSEFDGAISGTFSGMIPIEIGDGSISIKIALAHANFGTPLAVIMDGVDNSILDIVYLDWISNEFIGLSVDKDLDGNITISADSTILSRLAGSDFNDANLDDCDLLSEPYIAIRWLDSSVFEPASERSSSLDLSLVSFEGRHEERVSTLESNDIFINTDSKVLFSFFAGEPALFVDGYADGYIDGYADGYLSGPDYDVDEIYLNSDRFRYIYDTGEDERHGRVSLFKDGKGFLNFRIKESKSSSESGVFNIATNIKNFRPGELHHVAASWRLNTLNEQDEMHLFLDGLEAPNLYRFGGSAKIKINDKFSDIGQEVLHGFAIDNILFSDIYEDGTVSAGSSSLYSGDAGFSSDMVGRSIIIRSSGMAPTMVGEELIIGSVIDSSRVTIVSGINLNPVVFNTSASDIRFSFAPTAGIKSRIKTDLKNEKFSIYRKTCNGEEMELGGVLYSVDSGAINIISGDEIIKPSFRANVSDRTIEFVGGNVDCKSTDTIEYSDLDIHIRTFGLVLGRLKEGIWLSGSSYYSDSGFDIEKYSGKSILKTHSTPPIDLDDISMRRVVLDRMIPAIDSYETGPWGSSVDFEISLDSELGHNLLTSESGRISTQNLGRNLTLRFDSDNVIFCDDRDGYIDGYGASLGDSFIDVFGDTTDGVGVERVILRENGSVELSKTFLNVSRIAGSLGVADIDYEPCVVELVETDLITESVNGGETAEFESYRAGLFNITTAGTGGTVPFELHPGKYELDYPTRLKVSVPRIGKDSFIGTDIRGEGQFGGVIDEFKIISEMSQDTRPVATGRAGVRSITGEFNDPNRSCPDRQTLALIHFENPIELQRRRLRLKEFLNEETNFKFKLNTEQIALLLAHINNEATFVDNMMRIGFSKEDSRATYLESHAAAGGPIFNDATYYPGIGSSDISGVSVNSAFGESARFINSPPLILNNKDSYFRRDEGSIELWVSPAMDTEADDEDRYYIDIASSAMARVSASSPTSIRLPSAASKIIGIRLMRKTKEFSEFYTQEEADAILFDEIHRSQISGRLAGGTGTDKDFSVGAILSPNGREVSLREALPGHDVDVVVSYVPLEFSGDRISIYKSKFGQIVFSITASGIENAVKTNINWTKNTWHRIICTYKANSSRDNMTMFVDGIEGGTITYGTNLTYNGGITYGQQLSSRGTIASNNYKIKIVDDFRTIGVGGDILGGRSAYSRIDNIRFSRVARHIPRDIYGNYIDINYSENKESIYPIIEDDMTTAIINFTKVMADDENFASIIDPERGIYNFDIEILDDLGRITDEKTEDLIIELVNRLKPAHSNALVKFPRNHC